MQSAVSAQEHVQFSRILFSPEPTWNLKKGPLQTTVLLKGTHMGFYVSLGECGPIWGPSSFMNPENCLIEALM